MYISKSGTGEISMEDITSNQVVDLPINNSSCSNITSIVNESSIPEVSDSYEINLTLSQPDRYNMRVSAVMTNMSDSAFNSVEYIIYRSVEGGEFVEMSRQTQTNKSENFLLIYDDTISDITQADMDYKVIAYTEYNQEIDQKTSSFRYWVCFVAGTKVLTETGYKNIEDIETGEKVYSYNLDTNVLELSSVLKLINSSTSSTYKMTIGGEIVEMSPKHQLYIIDKGWVRAYDVKIGDKMLRSNEEKIEITKIDYIEYDEPIPTYNLSIENNSNYFVTNIQVLVHNEVSRE